jgi:hypothetical protein
MLLTDANQIICVMVLNEQWVTKSQAKWLCTPFIGVDIKSNEILTETTGWSQTTYFGGVDNQSMSQT